MRCLVQHRRDLAARLTADRGKDQDAVGRTRSLPQRPPGIGIFDGQQIGWFISWMSHHIARERSKREGDGQSGAMFAWDGRGGSLARSCIATALWLSFAAVG